MLAERQASPDAAASDANVMSFQTTERAVVPYPHRLPKRLTWGIHILTSVVMAFLNLVQIFLIKTLVHAKFDVMQLAIDYLGVMVGVLVLVAISMFFALCCLGVIFGIEPQAAGSGAPENKGWLNGTKRMANSFTWRTMFVRATATLFSNASGFPVGREGPTVTMGSNTAFCITEMVSSFWVRQRVRSMPPSARAQAVGSDEEITASILERARFQEAKRNACVVGGACGMTMIFDSPIGGIIYMFEEIGAMSWGADITFMAFTATVLCDVLMRFCLELSGSDMKQWVIFQVDLNAFMHPEATWTWPDVPFFVLLACVLGPFSALHTRLCLALGGLRQRVMGRMRWPKASKILEGVLFAALCAFVASLAAHIGGCKKSDEDLEDSDLELVRFGCKGENMYNPVASLLVTTSEAAMKLLISRTEEDTPIVERGDFFEVSDLLLAFVAYTAVNIGLTGIPVPSGNFTGTMLIGGFVGRALGVSVKHWYPDTYHAKPGVYAMVGSAAMLCGFKRMSMAVVLFIAECGDDWNLIPPLMISVCTSLSLSKRFLKNGFDEEQMMRKGIHFLHPEPHRTLYGHDARAFLDNSVRTLPLQIRVEELRNLLKEELGEVIAVVSKGICAGFTTPARLRSALQSEGMLSPRMPRWSAEPRRDAVSDVGNLSESLVWTTDDSGRPTAPELNLELLVDASPYKVDEDMPAPQVYSLFAKAGICHACVISAKGEFRGVISRTSLSAASRRLHGD